MAAEDGAGAMPPRPEGLASPGPAFEGSTAPSWLLASSVQSHSDTASTPSGAAPAYPQLNFFTDTQLLPSMGSYQHPTSPSDIANERAVDAKATGNKTLYIGNLHPFVTESMLAELLAGCDGINELKIIKDKATGIPAGYGFAKFAESVHAKEALDRLGKPLLFGQEVRISWAFQKEQRDELGHHTHIFVGDLGADVTDEILLQAFERYPGCSDARVIWDHSSGRSRGYGFVSFTTWDQAEVAISGHNGQPVASRRVRCGWAQHKLDSAAAAGAAPDALLLDRADPTNTNVYVGNLDPTVGDAEVRRHFGTFGPLAEVKLHRKGCFGFVRYRHHADAVAAIVGSSGRALGNKVLKCSWGRHPSLPPSGLHTSLLMATGIARGGPTMLPMGLAGPPLQQQQPFAAAAAAAAALQALPSALNPLDYAGLAPAYRPQAGPQPPYGMLSTLTAGDAVAGMLGTHPSMAGGIHLPPGGGLDAATAAALLPRGPDLGGPPSQLFFQ